jgi:iron complex outermembrane recepter protein
VQRHLVGLRYERKTPEQQLRAQAFASTRSLRYRENYTGYTLDTRSDGGPQRGDGTEQSLESFTFGSRGRLARTFSLLDRQQEVEVGYLGRHDRGDSSLRRLRRADGVPYAVDFDNSLAISNLGIYGGMRFSPWSWLVMRGGLRVDSFVFAVEDLDEPEVDRTGTREPSSNIEAFGFAVQPRGGVSLLFTPWLSWTTSVGVGTRSSDAQALSDGESAPFARVVATETGLVAKHTEARGVAAEARLIAFNTNVTNDLVFDERAGRNTPIGASNRFGASIWGRLEHRPTGLDVATSLTYTEAYLRPEDAGLFDIAAGVRLPYVPRWVLRSDLSERFGFGVGSERLLATAGLGLSFVDSRPLPFDQLAIPIGTVDLALRLRWRIVELGVEGTNLLDRRNREVELNYPSNFADPEAPASRLPARHLIAGPPLQLLGSLTLYLDASETSP